jgi:acyl-homoserine-lactone acylase
VVCALVAAVALPAAADARSGFSASIRRTEYGIPHIKAKDFAGLGFGYGYAFAQDDICTMADDYVTVSAQRARWFGPGGSYVQRGNGTTVNNLDSDLFWKQVIDSGVVERLRDRPPPDGPRAEVREGVQGYVAGYNRYLQDVGGAGGISDPRCRGAAWVRPITEIDAYRRFYQLVLLASSGVAITGIAQAQPPTPSAPGPGQASSADTAQRLDSALKDGALGASAVGSNAVAVGREGTADHQHGLLLGNPHFPWLGPERFYQFQYTIPRKVDVAGAGLFGVPLVLIGHTATMAWSHTVSTAFRFTPFQLTLVPGSPTTYLVDGKPERMTSRTVTVQSRQDDGSLKDVSRTLYSTRWGPVFNSLVGVPLPWTPTTAFALGDVNAENFRVFNHFFEVDQASSAPQVLDILERYQGIPWVNTIAADKQGNALYADIGAIPNVSDAKAQQCNTPLGAATFQALRLPVLDGSRSSCAWDDDADAAVKGIFGPSHEPHLFRDDYVTNSNDSYWLSNPHQPLEGFARIIGDERAARSLRTRIGLIMTQDRVDGDDGLGPAGFTRQGMQDILFGDRVYSAELARDDAVGMCRQFEQAGGQAPTSSGGPVAVGNACDVLAAWDTRDRADSRGAVLWRRFWDRAGGASGGPWLHPFDASDPVHTPNTLDTAHPTVRTALGDAIKDLRSAGIALDAPLGDAQFVTREGERIPIHGGPGPNGQFNVITTPFSSQSGIGEPVHGSSFVQVVTWNDGPCPDAATILTYSLSENPDSPHRADQTRVYSRGEWVPERFCEDAIQASPALSVTNIKD